jgi:arylsulfatase A-like enzyme
VINYPELGQVEPWLAGPDESRAARTLVSGIDADIGQILAEVRREHVFKDTVFVLTSDQAVSPLDQRTPTAAIGRAVVAAGGSVEYTEPGETALVGLQDTLQGPPVTQALQDEHIRGLDALYYKLRSGNAWTYVPQYLDPDLLPAFGRTLKYELSTLASGTSPDVVAVGSPHAGIVSGVRGGHAPLGSGLGAQWDTQHIPLVIAGHGVLSNVTSDYPARLVDLAPTIATLLGLATPGGEGNTLADALRQPTGDQTRAQSDAGAELRVFVAALRAREQQVAQ